MYQNDLLGLEFSNIKIDGKVMGPPISGRYVLEQNYQISLSRGKWADLGVIALMCVGYRIIFFLAIKMTEGRGQVRKVTRAISSSCTETQQQEAYSQQLQRTAAGQQPAPSISPSPANEHLPLQQHSHFWAPSPSPQHQPAPPSLIGSANP
jgi:hypothetical protein